MLVREAMEIARQWVRENAGRRSDFRGAYFSGSILDQPEDAPLPESSDVDVVVVVAQMPGSESRTKLRVDGVLIEVTHMAVYELDEVQHVAGTFYLAHSFWRGAVIADPTGQLRRLHDAIAANFDQPSQIFLRCNDVFDKMYRRLITFDLSGSWDEQIMGWMFPTSLSAVAIVVAGKMNPTVRTRYLAAQKVLYSRCMTSAYEDLLELFGCREVSRETAQYYLNGLAHIFDSAAAVGRHDFPFSCDITPPARSVAIDGSQQLIDAGHHREAVFWIIATHARCTRILNAEGVSAAGPSFVQVVVDLLRIGTRHDLERRRNQALSFIPTLRGVVRNIVAGEEI